MGRLLYPLSDQHPPAHVFESKYFNFLCPSGSISDYLSFYFPLFSGSPLSDPHTFV